MNNGRKKEKQAHNNHHKAANWAEKSILNIPHYFRNQPRCLLCTKVVICCFPFFMWWKIINRSSFLPFSQMVAISSPPTNILLPNDLSRRKNDQKLFLHRVAAFTDVDRSFNRSRFDVALVIWKMIFLFFTGGSKTISSLIYQSGDTALLPCDISVPPNSENDELVLVMWYREDVRSPIYSVDARSGVHIPSTLDGDKSSSSHWIDTKLFGHNRVVFDLTPGPQDARLKVYNVSEADDGLYRCRVDFKASQTRTSRVNLTVIGKHEALKKFLTLFESESVESAATRRKKNFFLLLL